MRIKSPTIISGPSMLRAHYTDRSGIRTAGAVVGIVGTLGGLFMVMSSLDEHRICDNYGYCHQADDVNEPLLVSGLSVFLGSAIAASIMIWQRDEATLSVTPLRWPFAHRLSRDAGTTSPWRRVHGASVTLTF